MLISLQGQAYLLFNVLVLAGMELIFFIATYKMLYLRFMVKILLITD